MNHIKPGQRIWFCWVSLGEEIHAQALGFTTAAGFFCHAETQANAELGTRLCLERGGKTYGKPIKVKSVKATLALEQDTARYVWPEKHVDAEAEIAADESKRAQESALRDTILKQ